MLYIYALIALYEAYGIEAYTNNLLSLIPNQGNFTGGCRAIADVETLMNKKKLTMQQKTTTLPPPKYTRSTTVNVTTSTPTTTTSSDADPIVGFEEAMNKVLFGENIDLEERVPTIHPPNVKDPLAMFPSGRVLRAELFQNKTGVHLPRSEFLHRGHLYLDMDNKDHLQTAVNAFCIFLDGTTDDVERLPAMYVLRSARGIAMMKIAREKLVSTWKVVKGSKRTDEITHMILEAYRPLFKYVNGREMARLNLDDERILSFLGTHPELDRHQVGVIASEYIKRNPNWSDPKYLNLMNNLLCGVPMKFMRKIPENVYLQLSHELFYHIKACDPLQRRFFLGMMTRTQVLGKSNSWSARDVARLGLLLSEVEGPDLSAINPEAMAGITPHAVMEMSPRNLIYLTETQTRYLAQKPRNILTKKMNNYDEEEFSDSYSSVDKIVLSNFIFFIVLAINTLVSYVWYF